MKNLPFFITSTVVKNGTAAHSFLYFTIIGTSLNMPGGRVKFNQLHESKVRRNIKTRMVISPTQRPFNLTNIPRDN